MMTLTRVMRVCTGPIYDDVFCGMSHEKHYFYEAFNVTMITENCITVAFHFCPFKKINFILNYTLRRKGSI